MIFIKVDEKEYVQFTHYQPFDEVHGLGKSKEDLELEGFLVDSLPTPDSTDPSKISILKFDGLKFYYEYKDRPLSPEEKTQQLEQDLGQILMERAADKAKIAELEKAQGDLLMELATLKMGGSA